MKNQLKVQSRMAVLHPSMVFVLNGIALGVYWIGAVLISSAGVADQMTLFSDMVVFSSYAVQVIMAVYTSHHGICYDAACFHFCQAYNEVLNTSPKMDRRSLKDGMQGQEGTVEVKNVSFAYPGWINMLSKISISLQIRRDRDSARCDRKWKEHDCQFGGAFLRCIGG